MKEQPVHDEKAPIARLRYTEGECVLVIDPIVFPPGQVTETEHTIALGTVGEIVATRDPRKYMYPYAVRFDGEGVISLTEDQARQFIAPVSLVSGQPNSSVYRPTVDRPHRNCLPAHSVNAAAVVVAYLGMFWYEPYLCTIMALPLFALAALIYLRQGGEGTEDLEDGEILHADPSRALSALRWDTAFGVSVLLFILVVGVLMVPAVARSVGVPVMSALIFGLLTLTLTVYGIKVLKHRAATVILRSTDVES